MKQDLETIYFLRQLKHHHHQCRRFKCTLQRQQEMKTCFLSKICTRIKIQRQVPAILCSYAQDFISTRPTQWFSKIQIHHHHLPVSRALVGHACISKLVMCIVMTDRLISYQHVLCHGC